MHNIEAACDLLVDLGLSLLMCRRFMQLVLHYFGIELDDLIIHVVGG